MDSQPAASLDKAPNRKRTFTHRGIELPYWNHPYNFASHNMRSIEVPIVRRYIELMRKRNSQAVILEFGNVLGHYGARDWTVLDGRESGPMIVNADVMRWIPEVAYDLIVSISTIEHVGFGAYAELTLSQPLPSEVIKTLKSWLSKDGILVATVPARFNPILDLELGKDSLGIDYAWYMRRINDVNEWVGCTRDEALEMPFGKRWPWGSGMCLLQVGELAWE